MTLYTPDSNGGWTYNPASHTERSIDEWIKGEITHCASDPLWFLTKYCFAQNLHDEEETQGAPSVELIPDWQHVRAFASSMFPPRDIVTEKTRRMMASWLAMAILVWDMRFRQHWPTMVMSRVEDDVDDGGSASTPRTLLGKVRFVYDHLPPFLQRPALEFKYLSVLHPVTGSFIAGFPSSQSPGRGGGFRRAILDEFAWVPHSEQAMASVTQACSSGKVFISTPHGKGNAFFRLAEMTSKPVWPPTESEFHRELPTSLRTVTRTQDRGPIERFTIHWTQHPHKSPEWYQRAKAAMTDEAVAQEFDINYTRSLGRRVYPKYAEDQHMAGGPLCLLSSVTYQSSRPLIVTCDWNHDPLIWEIAQQYGEAPCYRVIGELCLRSAVVDDALLEFVWRYGSKDAIPAIRSALPEMVHYLDNWKPRNELIHALAGSEGHRTPLYVYGDASEEKSTVQNLVKTYQHCKAILRAAGFDVQLRVPPKNPAINRRFEVVNHALQVGWVVVSPECEELRKDFESGIWDASQKDMDQRTADDDGSGLTRSHASSAIGYWLCCTHKVMTSETPTTRAFARSAASYIPKNVTGWG